MRTLGAITTIILYSFLSMAQDGIEPYVDFLKRGHLSPKEYVLKLFETADIVVLGERDHRDTTQYSLILDILSDERFIENVGNVYTEVGVVNMTDRANALIKGDYSSKEEFNKAFVQYHIDDVWAPLWDKYNRYQLLWGLATINSKLPEQMKVSIGLTDMEFTWKGMNAEKYRHFNQVEMNKAFSTREQIMAKNFSALFENQTPRNGSRKALLIVSREYAGKYDLVCNGVHVKREASIIADLYPGKVKTVAINWYKWMPLEWQRKLLPNKTIGLSANGKWDAAFELTSHHAVGFNLADTPFGLDGYDYDFGVDLKWQDVFDGYIFYTPYHQLVGAAGFPTQISTRAARELTRREIVYLRAYGNKGLANLLSLVRWKYKYDVKKEYSQFRTFPCVSGYINADTLNAEMQQWLSPQVHP